MLPACGTGSPASNPASRVGSVVHLGRYTQVFAGPLPSAPAQAAVVEGFREGQVLWNQSLQTWQLAPSARDYVTGQALAHLDTAMKALRARDDVPAGADRLFMTQVATITARSAIVTTCDNGSSFAEENRRTGKVDYGVPEPPGQDYLFETWRMTRLSGHWAITAVAFSVLPSRSAEHCQPGITGSGPSVRPDLTVLLRRADATVRAASSVHLSGTSQLKGTALGLNAGITGSGGFWGQISENGTVLTVLATHGHSYVQVTAAFLRSARLPATACSRYCGKYLESATRSHALSSRLGMTSLTHSLPGLLAGQVKYVGAVTVDGQLAWLVQDSRGNSTYIAAHGTPYILREVAPADGGTLTFTQWNAARVPAPPPASQIVSLSQLAGAATGTE